VLQGEAEVARCVAEANVFALASHQYWGTWSLLQVRQGDLYAPAARLLCAGCSLPRSMLLACSCPPGFQQASHHLRPASPLPAQCLQAKWSSIDFDYLSYSQLRWAEYRRRRDEFLTAAAAAFQEQQQQQ
jgi:hypothetical protein